jgi:hypothetical protein
MPTRIFLEHNAWFSQLVRKRLHKFAYSIHQQRLDFSWIAFADGRVHSKARFNCQSAGAFFRGKANSRPTPDFQYAA